MRVAVVFCAEKRRDRLRNCAAALAAGIEEQGYHVDLFDGDTDINISLTIYNYIAVGVTPSSIFGGKIPATVSALLENSGMLAGKRSCAFAVKTAGGRKALQKLMKVMEHEGMFLKYSDLFSSPEEAEETGKLLHIK